MPPPISVAQEAMWYAGRLAPNRLSYHEIVVIRKDGELDPRAFRRAFAEILRRHAAWRTTFDVVGGEPIQVVHEVPNLELPVLDLSHIEEDAAERRCVELVTEVVRTPYDLRRGPLLRARLIKVARDRHRLYLAMHHLIFDVVSIYRVVLPELVALYDAFRDGRPSPLAEPAVTYADYARWEQEWIESDRARSRLEYWRGRLDGVPFLGLPIDRRRSVTPEFRAAFLPLTIPAATVAELRSVAQRSGATLFQILATAWAVLLAGHSGSDDVTFSTAADLRQRPEFESVVGCALTPLVFRVDLRGDPPFTELVVRVRNEVLDALDNLLPFERVVRELEPDTVAGANPIYQTMIVLEPPIHPLDPSWSVHLMESAISDAVGAGKLDLELSLDERPEGFIEGRLIFDPELFAPPSAEAVVDHLLGILGSVAADPELSASALRVSSGEDRRRLVEWNATETQRPFATLGELVEAQAERTPTAAAVSDREQTFTYRELLTRAERTARRLQAAGLGPGDVIAFCAEPSAVLVADVLGTLHAGAAYLLLDPTRPDDELDHMVTEAAASAVYAGPHHAGRLAGQTTPLLTLADTANGSADLPIRVGADADPTLCVQFGVGERPVATAIHHGAAANCAVALADQLGITSSDTVLVLPGTLYRAASFELWLGLHVGARVVLAGRADAADGRALSRLISQERVSFVHASPAEWATVLETGLRPARGLVALSGGGTLDGDLAERILTRARVLYHGYGSPETSGYALVGRVDPGRPVTVGRPIANMRAHVVNRDLQPVSIGIVGQLVLAGTGIARPAQGRGALPVVGFCEEPDGTGPAFATSQRARWRVDGRIEIP